MFDLTTLLIVLAIYGGGALFVAFALYGIVRLAVSHALRSHAKKGNDL